MSRLAKEAAKNARNTPKAVYTSLAPLPLPQVVEAEQAPTTGIPPVPDPLEPTPLPQVVEAEQAPTTGIPPVPVPLDPAPLPQDIETSGVPTPEPTTSPLEAIPPAQVPLTGAQTTAANTTRNRALNAARLFRYRQGLNSLELLILEALNSAARTSITTHATRSKHVRLQKCNLAALSNANSELSTFKATTLKDARILAIRAASVARRISQTAPSVLRASVVQELDAHLLCITGARLAPCSLRMLFHRISLTAPSPPDPPTRKRMQALDPTRLYKAATRRVKAATLNLNHLLETQKRLIATKDGPFLDPGSTPPVLNSPFVPPSWAAVITGGYRKCRIDHARFAKLAIKREESRRTLTSRRRTSRRRSRTTTTPRRNAKCKTPRSCAGPRPGPQHRSGLPHATPSRSSHTPARPYCHNDGDGHRERDGDGRGRPPPPPPPPTPPRGDLPHPQIRCQFSSHGGQCWRTCKPNRGIFPFRLVRKHTTLTFCSKPCLEAFTSDEVDTLISQPFPPHARAAVEELLNTRVLELIRGVCSDNPWNGFAWPLRSILDRTVRTKRDMSLHQINTCAVISRFLYDITNNAVNHRVEEDVYYNMSSVGLLRWAENIDHHHLF